MVLKTSCIISSEMNGTIYTKNYHNIIDVCTYMGTNSIADLHVQ